MERAFDNVLRWSHSRYNAYAECPRKYYYHYYLSDGGWFSTASAQSQLAYQLKKLRPMPMHAGIVMHDAIARWIANQLMPIGTMETETLAIFCKSLAASKQNVKTSKYGNKFIQLAEHYYGLPLDENAWIMKMYTFFKALREIKEKMRDVLCLPIATSEEYLNFTLKTGAAVSVKLDVGFKNTRDNRLTIVDWKTGKHDAKIQDQMLVYAMAAIKLGFASRPEDITMTPVFLGEADPSQRLPILHCTMQELIEKSTEIDGQYRVIKAADPHRSQISFFQAKPCRGKYTCSSCNFRKMCPDVVSA